MTHPMAERLRNAPVVTTAVARAAADTIDRMHAIIEGSADKLTGFMGRAAEAENALREIVTADSGDTCGTARVMCKIAQDALAAVGIEPGKVEP
jgi:hypothetical protein